MSVCVVKRGCFIAPGQKRINPVLLAAIALAMAGCAHSDESQAALAPPPPTFDVSAAHETFEPQQLRAFTGQPIPFPSHIKLSEGVTPVEDSYYAGTKASLKTEQSSKKCSVKDRIDRDDLIAYQWGRNRLGLDVDGINMRSTELEGFKLQYTLRLQPHKTRKEKCRYESGWQGMIGSGYNEMFLRQEDTIWMQLDKIKNDAEDAVDKLF